MQRTLRWIGHSAGIVAMTLAAVEPASAQHALDEILNRENGNLRRIDETIIGDTLPPPPVL